MPRRGRRYQPGQPAAGVQGVQDGGEGVRGLSTDRHSLIKRPTGHDGLDFLCQIRMIAAQIAAGFYA
jgi:hypothetical protein